MSAALLDLARSALRGGDAAQAVRLAQKVLKSLPDDREAMATLATAEHRLGRFDAAEALFSTLTELEPQNAGFWLGLALAHKGADCLEPTYDAVRRSVDLDADNPLAQNTLGLCAMHLNRGDEALAAFDAAIRLDPMVPALHRNRGLVLVGLSRHVEAYDSFARALDLAPNDVASLVQVASLHLRHDRTAEAVTFAARALALKPDDPEAMFYLARAHAHLGQSELAYQEFQRAADREPAYRTPFAIWLIEEGRLAEANALLAQQSPDDGVARYYFIETQGFPATGEQLEQLTRIATDETLPVDAQAFANYALGKARERSGDYAESMSAYDRANARFFGTKLKHVHDLMGTIDAEVADAKRIFTREKLADLREQGLPDARPIFIVGMIRSGTTLLEQVVSSHSQVAPAGELRFWMERGPYALQDLSQLPAFGEAYSALISQIHPTASRITDKMPLNLRFLGMIQAAFPKATFLWIRRDPMDTCFSVYTTPFTDPPIFSYNLRNIGTVFRKYEELMQHWQSVLPAGAVLEVRYEDLVSDLEAQTRRIFEYLELPFEEACLHPEQNAAAVRTPSSMQVRRPVNRNAVERWRPFAPWLGELVAGLNGE